MKKALKRFGLIIFSFSALLLAFVGISNSTYASSTGIGNSAIILKYKHDPYKNVPASIKKKYYDCYSKPERVAKNYIAFHESSYSYTASNGKYHGRFQLLKSSLKGNLSKENQEKTANKYVKDRYGTWEKAKDFWVSHKPHWYQVMGGTDVIIPQFSKASKALPSALNKYWFKYRTVRVRHNMKANYEKLGVKNNTYIGSKKIRSIKLKKNQKIKVKSFGTFGWKLKGHGMKNSTNYYWTVNSRSTKWMKK